MRWSDFRSNRLSGNAPKRRWIASRRSKSYWWMQAASSGPSRPRGLRGYCDGTANVSRITAQLRLPAFRYVALDPYTWPPARK
jgi:hypothetical protein